MAIEFSSATALTQAVRNSQALQSVRASQPSVIDGVNSTALGDGIAAGRFVERVAIINVAQAQEGLRGSLTSGNAIRDALFELIGVARVAINEGLVSESTNFLVDGTRVSRGNIQAQFDRAVGLIDTLVAANQVGAANFIDGSGPAIRIQTSSYGGSITILPQGFDSASLGLQNLDVSSPANARLTEQRLIGAAQTAESQVIRLEQLQTALGNGTALGQSFTRFVTDISGAVPVGAFVDLSA